MTDEARLDTLEVTVAHQAETIEELSGQIARQWETIDRLERRLKALTDRFLALEEAATPRPEATRPPHY